LDEDSSGNEGSLGAHLGEYISCHIVVPKNVVEFEAIEVGLEPTYLLAVGIHFLLGVLLVLVYLLYDDLGVAIGKESLDAKESSDPETMNEGLVLCCIVGGFEE